MHRCGFAPGYAARPPERSGRRERAHGMEVSAFHSRECSAAFDESGKQGKRV
jgi:hypothetical protein